MEVNWRNKLPCLIVFGKGVVTWNFVSAHEKRETICSFVAPVRDPCFVRGPLFALRPVPSHKLLPASSCCILDCSCCQEIIRAALRSPCCVFCAPSLQCDTLADTAGSAVLGGLDGTTTHATVLLPSPYVSIALFVFLLLNRSWGSLISDCHTLRLGDCGWRLAEISIAAAVQAEAGWITGLICLYRTWPSNDLIWLNVLLREEDWPKPELGILCTPSCVLRQRALLWLNPLRGDKWRSACCAEAVFHHRLRSAAAWKWNMNEPDCLPFLTRMEGIHSADASPFKVFWDPCLFCQHTSFAFHTGKKLYISSYRPS